MNLAPLAFKPSGQCGSEGFFSNCRQNAIAIDQKLLIHLFEVKTYLRRGYLPFSKILPSKVLSFSYKE